MTYIHVLLLILGVVSAVHLICTANFLSPRAPWSLGIEVASGFASSIGIIVTSLQANEEAALKFAAFLAFCKIIYSIEQAIRKKTFFNHRNHLF